jgi:formate-dependent phosphoribosylglycinamide formyltransferase (GAR transformylase)
LSRCDPLCVILAATTAMTNVIFAAPVLSENAMRMIAATAALPGVRLGVIAQDPFEKISEPLRSQVAAHWRVDDVLDPDQLGWAVDGVRAHLGGADGLFAAYEQLQVPIALVRERFGIEGMSAEAARNFRDKARMKDLFAEAGVPCARHRRIHGDAEAWAFAEAQGYPLVYKPLEGAGARSTFRIDSAAQLHDALAIAPPRSAAPILLEEYVLGDEHSFEGVSVDGRLVWHSLTQYRPTPLEVLRNGWIQWSVVLPREVDDPRYDDIRAEAARALEVLGMRTGLCHLEWFRRNDGSIAISEVAARPPGAQIMDLVSYAHDVDFDAAWARLMVFGTFEPPSRRYAAGIAFLRGQGQGRVTAIHRVEQAAAEAGSLVVEARLPSIGQMPSGSYEGEGFIIVRHRETAVVEEALRRITTLVRVELG